jgi:hypothetical protein
MGMVNRGHPLFHSQQEGKMEMLNVTKIHDEGEPAFDYANLKAHELADLLPMIDGVNFENLKADIAKNGILEPILLFEGRILDGRNRYRAAKALGKVTRWPRQIGRTILVALIGAKGAGKGTLVRCLQRIFGAHTFQVTSREQTHTLPSIEQWYLSLLRDGRVPGALVNDNPKSKKLSRPSTAYTKSLREDAMQRYPRLRFELSDNMIEEFMTNQSWPKATKHRDNKNNGWTFEPLTESRAEWDKRYGPQPWDDTPEWIGGRCGRG